VDGKCTCPAGFEGTDCEVASAYKFQGIWAAYDTSLYYFSASYLSKITRSPTEPTIILVSNLRNWGSNLVFSFSADGQSVSLDPSDQVQSIHTVTSASGTLSSDGKSLSIIYTYHDTGGDTTVTGNWTLRIIYKSESCESR
jgi:hypothetical protein